ncbi:MAG: type II toxin-antitoxin system RatA family toxin [Gammaproteobacteria bacterium]|nr:type II toxin-antitoxin system RatA family toxin [Gammaproteobacteria bacterium]
MGRIHKSLVMPYRVDQIYTIVADVVAYPQFLPWCGGARILKQEGNSVEAEITIAKGPVRVAFATVNQLMPNERIAMRLAQGPFKELTGAWVFEDLGDDSCRVTLSLEFEFNNRLLAMTVGSVFEQVISSLIDAFLVRAKDLYGS